MGERVCVSERESVCVSERSVCERDCVREIVGERKSVC